MADDINLIVVGDLSVGKSSLTIMYTQNVFVEDYGMFILIKIIF